MTVERNVWLLTVARTGTRTRPKTSFASNGRATRCPPESLRLRGASKRSTGLPGRAVQDLECLEVAVEVERVVAAFAADAGDAHSAERRREIADEKRIDPDGAAPDRASHPVGSAEGPCVDDAREAVVRRVRERDRFLFVREGLNRQYGAEHLALDDLRVVLRGLDHGRLVEEPAELGALAATDDTVAGGAGPLDEALHAGQVVRVDEGRDRRA